MGTHETENFLQVKDTVNRTKQKPTYWEKILNKMTHYRELLSKIHEEPKKLGFQKPILKWGQEKTEL